MRNRGRAAIVPASLVISSTALIALATLQYGMPTHFYAIMGLGRENVPHFRKALHVGFLGPMSIPSFLLWFRLLLAVSWCGYLVAVIAVFRNGVPSERVVVGTMVVVAALLAFWWPASLSGDVYGYAAFARMYALHGLNPYTHTPDALHALGDPSAPFARFRHTTIYGPVWTLVSVVIVWALKSVGLWWQVVALKLLAGLSLVMCALVGRRIAEHFASGRGDLALLAIGLNPLFLVESPANGHNDAFMMMMLLIGVWLWLEKRSVPAAVALGISVGVKFITAPILFWMLLDRVHRKGITEKLAKPGGLAILSFVPLALCYLPFWHGAALLAGASHRWRWGTIWSSASKQATPTYWLERYLLPGRTEQIATFLTGPWPILLPAVVLTLWLWLRKAKDGWLTAWVMFAGCLALFTMGVPFPWYFIWGWMVSLLRWNRAHIILSGAYFVLGLVVTMGYTIPR